MNNISVLKVGYLTSRNTKMSIFVVPVCKTGRLKRGTESTGWLADKSAADFSF